MDIQNIGFKTTVENITYKTKPIHNSEFKNLLDKLTGGDIAQEIKDRYDVTLNVSGVGTVNQLLDNYDIRCKNYVGISQGTLAKMETDPALKKKAMGAIEEFCSPEEQAKVNALQPPVKSAGMLIYPNGDTLYWLESYPNEIETEKNKKIVSAGAREDVVEKYNKHEFVQENIISETSLSILATSFTAYKL